MEKGDKRVTCLLINPRALHSCRAPGPIPARHWPTHFPHLVHRRCSSSPEILRRRSRISVGSFAPRPAGGRPGPSTRRRHQLPPDSSDTKRAAREVADRFALCTRFPTNTRGCCEEVAGEPTQRVLPSNGLGVEAAQQICRACPVKNECLEYTSAKPHRTRRVGWRIGARTSPHLAPASTRGRTPQLTRANASARAILHEPRDLAFVGALYSAFTGLP